jgi:hypothetical protein
MDALVESTPTAYIQPAGVVISDSGDAGWTKSLQRIFGFLMKAGTPVFTSLQAPVNESDQASYRRLGIHKTSKEVFPMDNYSESPGISATGQHAVSVKQGSEKVVGPVYFPCFLTNPITLENELTVVPSMSSNFNKSYTLSDPQISAIVKNQDHYYVNVKLSFFCVRADMISLFLNTFRCLIHKSYHDNSSDIDVASYSTVYVPIKVLTSNNQLIFNMNNSATLNDVRLGIQIIGLFI